MRISYNWLKTILPIDLTPDEVSVKLTACGLEVESIETIESIKGGLKGLVVGHVVSKEKHPDADRLNLTKVDVGTGELLSIVCGAPNVEAGQKVIVATVGTTCHPLKGDAFEIKKSKIRGQLSEGMICAEDEIGLGESHDGIMILPAETVIGTPAASFFKIENDYAFEIGLTPNRGDAASHWGVAQDLCAILNVELNEMKHEPIFPTAHLIENDSNDLHITVNIKNPEAAPRYSGVTIDGLTIKESPDWLKNHLKAIGVRPINNVVDVTNYVLHELGQPLHAFDAAKIAKKEINVRFATEGELFTTLDGTERKLSDQDLVIADGNNPMCLAGVFGGLTSGVSESTTSIFLECAYFNPADIRKSSKRHGLKTDASFRFERGTDPEMVVKALERAVFLIQQLAGGDVAMEMFDNYPVKLEPVKIAFSYDKCNKLIGKQINKASIKIILESLGIVIVNEGGDALMIEVPSRKYDVTREADVVEEVMRVYGYNNIEPSTKLNASIVNATKPNVSKLENAVANYLSDNGFNEIMSTSLTSKTLYEKFDAEKLTELVDIVNPLSSDLDVMRASLIYSGLQALSYNANRKNADLKLYEFGRIYAKTSNENFKYIEQKQLAIFVMGNLQNEHWTGKSPKADVYYVKSAVMNLLQKLSFTNLKLKEVEIKEGNNGFELYSGKHLLANIYQVKQTVCKHFDLSNPVYVSILNWDNIIAQYKDKTNYQELTKFPPVRRDLSLMLDKSTKYSQLEELAFQTERKLLKEVNLFDIYEGDKIDKDKKSYALSFTLVDNEQTLTVQQIDKVMEKLSKTFAEKLNAQVRM